jgi:nicotinamide-nucleotide amidase
VKSVFFPPALHDLAQKIVGGYAAEKKKIVTAESCTGGLVAAALTDIPGSSAVVERGFVAYSNDAKVEVLGVLPDFLEQHGAVSAEVAEAMATGALEYSLADVAVSVTGIAGPGGGTLAKPIGLVYFGLATRSGVVFHVKGQYKGDRGDIRTQAAREALTLLAAQIGG